MDIQQYRPNIDALRGVWRTKEFEQRISKHLILFHEYDVGNMIE